MLMAMKIAAMDHVTMRVVKLSAKVPTMTLLEVKLSTCERRQKTHKEGASSTHAAPCRAGCPMGVNQSVCKLCCNCESACSSDVLDLEPRPIGMHVYYAYTGGISRDCRHSRREVFT